MPPGRRPSAPAFEYSSVAPLPQGIPDFPVYEGDLYPLQLTGFYVLTDTLVARRKEAGDALHFAEDLKTYEDLECFYRLSQRGKAAFLDVETVRQLDHPNDRLSQLASIDKIDARLTLMRRFWGADAAFLQEHSALYRRSHDRSASAKGRAPPFPGKKPDGEDCAFRDVFASHGHEVASLLPGWLTARALELRRRSREH